MTIESTNEEFARITDGMTEQQVVDVFNKPNYVFIKRHNITCWRCTDKLKTHYRNMHPAMLELYKIKAGIN